ncbi:dihydrodipicolinate synthase family protein [Diaminobutyricibacter tongyongensis]|uniref:Dihydrodipicolinate synthase family protein n=1 Tax=Leifsonia tongyongensis TaxID=1268043 RepID=A0A6L9Y3M6_9MICO|nr:dihydrodipicolinate synthase family protein [Diaminobutyricibacter tongyongensis]NEN07824.1 dihydrodipicolinate synthase family protein [Diaminobutyricibacter tongyongensis]
MTTAANTVGERNAAPLEPGVWGVLATPFAGPNRDLDLPSLTRLVQFYEKCGATGLTVLGVFGEASSLSGEERTAILRTVATSTELPMVVGVSALATAPSIAEVTSARSAAGDRVRAVMVQINSGSPQVVIEHLHAIHAETNTPIVLQDYPVASHVTVSTDRVIEIVEACPFVCAVKAEAPPTAAAIARIVDRVSVSVFGGLGGQSLLDELAAGAAGAMTGFSFPEALVGCVSAWHAGDSDSAREAFIRYLPLVNYEQQPRVALALRKDLLARRGLIGDGAVRPPAAAFPEQLREIAADQLRRAELIEERGR